MAAPAQAEGVITEGGGQWVGPGQDRILALIDELRLETFETYVDGKTIYLRKGKRVSAGVPAGSTGG